MTNTALLDKLRKVLALTTSPVEGEAQAAAAMLQKLLTQHNLDIADLEAKGGKAPGVREQGHDLGKAAFKWKLNLAEAIATHYYCAAIVNHTAKTVAFVGRPDNVDSLRMLYGWLIDQIKRISAEERRAHFVRTNEEIDPLRWQVSFGVGCVSRLRTRLHELERERAALVTETALVVHHLAEVSDYLETQYGYRCDGRKTKRQEAHDREWEKYIADVRRREAEAAEREEARRAALTPEQRAAEDAVKRLTEEKERKEAERERKREEARERRNARRRTGSYRPYSAERERREEESYAAERAGRGAADRVNLEPFINGEVSVDTKRRISK